MSNFKKITTFLFAFALVLFVFSANNTKADTRTLDCGANEPVEVVFNANSPEFPVPNTSAQICPGTNTTLPADFPPNYTMTGYDFDGWFDDKTDGNKITDFNNYDFVGPEVTFYAHWTGASVILDIDLNGGNYNGMPIVPSINNYKIGDTVKNFLGLDDSHKLVAPADKTFRGWEINGNIINLPYTLKASDISDSTSTPARIAVKAVYGDPYILTLDLQGGGFTNQDTPTVYPLAAYQTLTLPTDVKAPNKGLKFKEWNTQADGKGDAVTAFVMGDTDTTLYAIYENASGSSSGGSGNSGSSNGGEKPTTTPPTQPGESTDVDGTNGNNGSDYTDGTDSGKLPTTGNTSIVMAVITLIGATGFAVVRRIKA